MTEALRLCFEARSVDCANAMDGEILQVTFDSLPPSIEGKELPGPYLQIGRNFEFPGSAKGQWHDGMGDDGGAIIKAMILKRDQVSVTFEGKVQIEITFQIVEQEFARLKSYLEQMLEPRVFKSG